MRSKSRTIFLVLGRLGKSLTTYKILPVLETRIFDRILVFRERKGEPIEGVKYITLEFLSAIKPIWFRKVIQNVIEPIQLIFYSIALRPDVINGYQLVPKGINSLIASKISFRKCIISTIGGIPEIETYFKNRHFWTALNIMVLKYSDIVTTKGKNVTDYLINKGIDEGKIFTFNGSINLSRFKNKVTLARDIDILFVGNFSSLKGPDRVIKIILTLKQEIPDIKAVFLGTGVLFPEVEEAINDFKLKNNVKLEGHVEETEDYFNRAKILIMPSKSEGLSSAMLESMACGCVPIVSDVGCMNEAAINGENSILIENYDDIGSFSENALFLLKNHEVRESLARNGIEFVNEKYSDQEQARIFKEIWACLTQK